MRSYTPALYVHVPFCERRCDYCDFFSSCDYSISGEVMEQAFLQFQSHYDKLKSLNFSDSNPSIPPSGGLKSIYIGGGTPGSIDPQLIYDFLSKVKKYSDNSLPEEVSIECNPRNVTVQNLKKWEEAGITRLSMGVQSFQDDFLKRSGRQSSRKEILRALNCLSMPRTLKLSIDLIQGLPGMTKADQLADLREALSYEPDHISWYSLILEEGTLLEENWEERQNVEIDDETVEDIWEEGRTLLESAGYYQYEVSNFAPRGQESQHNLVYWHMEPFIGVGPSAVAMLPSEDGPRRFKCLPRITEFSQGEWMYEDDESIAYHDFLKDYLLMGLRIREGIKLKEINAIFSIDFESAFAALLSAFKNENMIEVKEGKIVCTKQGQDLLNSLLIRLYDYIDKNISSQQLNWPLVRI